MQEIYVEDLKKVLRDKKRLERELKIRISNRGQNIFINGNPEEEFIAIEVLKAINLGFSVSSALSLNQEGVILQIVNIKELTKRNDLKRIRARIIGTHGKTLKILKDLTSCNLSLHNNQIGIIGDAEEIEDAIIALTSLIQGSKHGNVYSRLEKVGKKKRLESRNLSLSN